MSLTVGELTGFLTLDKGGFDRDVDQSGSKFGAMAGGLGKAALAGGAVAGAAIAGLATKGLQEFAGLQSGMNEVFTLLPGISQQAMGDMTDDVRDFSREMGVLPDDVVPALYSSLSAGVPADNVFAFLETANQAALGGVTDLETAVDGISSVTNAYGDQISGAAEASDLMFTAVRLGKTNFEELSSSLFNVLPTASALGVGFGDITGAMAQMTAQGVPTSVATTQLRSLLVELSKDGSAASDAFKEIAGVGLKDFMAQGGNTADVLDIMQQAADDNGVAIQDMFGSVEAGAAALALAGDGTDAYRANLDEMANSAGATEAAHAQMDQGLGRAWDSIKANVAVALGEIGERLAPTFQGFADWIIANMPTVIDFIVGGFETIAAVAETLRDVLAPVFATVTEAVATIGATFTSSGEESNGAMTAIAEFVAEMWPQIQATITSVMESIQVIISGVLELVTTLWTLFGDDLMRFVQSTFDAIMKIIDGAMKVIRGVIETVLGLLTGDWSRAWEGIKNIASGVWLIIQGVVERAIATVRLVIDVGVQLIQTLWSGAWEAIKGLASSALSWLISTVSEKVEEITRYFRDLPGRMVDALGNVGDLLKGAGRAILDGLLDGLKASWENTKDFLSGLGSEIKNLKGPLSYDKVMLRPEAAAIMGGFNDELQRQWKGVERTLGTMTAEMPALMSYDQLQAGPVGGMGGAGRIEKHYHLHTTTGKTEADLTEQFRRMELLHG